MKGRGLTNTSVAFRFHDLRADGRDEFQDEDELPLRPQIIGSHLGVSLQPSFAVPV
jgi:hypothetical protein